MFEACLRLIIDKLQPGTPVVLWLRNGVKLGGEVLGVDEISIRLTTPNGIITVLSDSLMAWQVPTKRDSVTASTSFANRDESPEPFSVNGSPESAVQNPYASSESGDPAAAPAGPRDEPAGIDIPATPAQDNASVEAAAAESPTSPIPESLLEWIQTRTSMIHKYRLPEPEGILDQLALFMGRRYDTLSRTIAGLARAATSGLTISISLADAPARELADSTQLCTRLRDIGYLTVYQYSRPIRRITFQVPRDNHAIRFLQGEWLTRCVRAEVDAVVKAHGSDPPAWLSDVQVTWPDGDAFQLHLLAMVNDKPFWFQCKSSNHESAVTIVRRIQQRLGLGDGQAFLVVPAIDERIRGTLWALHRVEVVAASKLGEKFSSVLETTEPAIMPATLSAASTAQLPAVDTVTVGTAE